MIIFLWEHQSSFEVIRLRLQHTLIFHPFRCWFSPCIAFHLCHFLSKLMCNQVSDFLFAITFWLVTNFGFLLTGEELHHQKCRKSKYFLVLLNWLLLQFLLLSRKLGLGLFLHSGIEFDLHRYHSDFYFNKTNGKSH